MAVLTKVTNRRQDSAETDKTGPPLSLESRITTSSPSWATSTQLPWLLAELLRQRSSARPCSTTSPPQIVGDRSGGQDPIDWESNAASPGRSVSPRTLAVYL